MKKSGLCRRGMSLALALVMMVMVMFCTDVPVSAATIRSNRITASIQASGNIALRIKWTKSSLAQGYVIYRRQSLKLPWTRIAVVGKGATSYIDRNLTAGKPYQYAVRAYRKEGNKNVYSIFTPVIGATRPLKTTITARAVSDSRVNVQWTRITRCDGYYVYRRAAGEKWKFLTTLDRTKTSYADTKAEDSTKYVYCVRAYKKGGNVRYLAPMSTSNLVTTPQNTASSESHSRFNSSQKDVMKKILYAVETGGQVYGNQAYDDFTEAFTNSSTEYAITIGAGQWYATEAQRLLKLIHDKYPDTWERYDGVYGNLPKNLLWNDVVNKNWSTYKLTMSSSYEKTGKPQTTDDWKIYRIKLLINCEHGRTCQDQLMYEQIEEYEAEIRNLGITEAKAVGMLINVRHQGGYGAVTRILAKTKKPVTLDTIYAALNTDTGNQVGAYRTRQQKVYSWLKAYMK